MLIGASIGFILWALIVSFVTYDMPKGSRVNYSKVALLFITLMGSGIAIGYLSSRI